jgi:hypothetical protein
MKEAATPKVTWSGRLHRARRVLAVIVALVVVRVGWHLVMRDDARALIDGHAEGDLVARRDYLAAHVEDAAHALAPSSTQFAGEWSIVTLAMTSLAAANIGFEHSDTVPADLELIARSAELARAKEARAFDSERWGDDPIDAMTGPNDHAGYLGELGLVLEAYRVLGGHDAALLTLEGRVVSALEAKLRRAGSGLIATYPKEGYVADNAVALAVLALSDLGRGARTSGALAAGKGPHAALLAQTLAAWRVSLIDPATGVLVFEQGAHRARASGAAMSAMMLAYVDDAFAQAQAKALVEHFEDRVFELFAAVCESAACTGSGDVDSGPLVRGASPSATGFAIALAKRAGDEARLDRLLATAEWAGFTFAWSGRKRYLFSPLVGDAIVLAAKSARPWDVRYL